MSAAPSFAEVRVELARLSVRIGSLAKRTRGEGPRREVRSLFDEVERIRAKLAIADGDPVEILTASEMREWSLTGRWPARVDELIRAGGKS